MYFQLFLRFTLVLPMIYVLKHTTHNKYREHFRHFILYLDVMELLFECV